MKARLALLTTALVVASASLALAQNPPAAAPAGQGGPGGFAQRRMQALLNGITLTAAQQARFDSIQSAFRAQMPAFTPGQAPDPAAMQQRRGLMARQDSSLRGVLTPEQQQVWDRNAEQARSMQRRPPGE
jgi:Spy/CpxP family protein refolding chaperone